MYPKCSARQQKPGRPDIAKSCRNAIRRADQLRSLPEPRLPIESAASSAASRSEPTACGSPSVSSASSALRSFCRADGFEGASISHRHPEARGREAVGDLLDAAEEVDASLIAVGIKHRSPLGKLQLGSAAQQILLESACPVLAAKPERR